MMELLTVRAPAFQIPPPPDAKAVMVVLLFEMLELLTVRVPELLKAPPLPEVFAPETVTPEMERLPPEAMLKMLKLRFALLAFVGSLPLMISEEAPRPVIVTVPAVPLPTTVLALTMVGYADPSVIVFSPVKLKLI